MYVNIIVAHYIMVNNISGADDMITNHLINYNLNEK